MGEGRRTEEDTVRGLDEVCSFSPLPTEVDKVVVVACKLSSGGPSGSIDNDNTDRVPRLRILA